jgi:hypothetical protein
MKYIRLQRSHYEGIIAIGEYIQETEPNIYLRLKLFEVSMYFKITAKIAAERIRDVTEQVLQAADISSKNKFYARLMQERPLPGRGGLLRGEKEGALY